MKEIKILFLHLVWCNMLQKGKSYLFDKCYIIFFILDEVPKINHFNVKNVWKCVFLWKNWSKNWNIQFIPKRKFIFFICSIGVKMRHFPTKSPNYWKVYFFFKNVWFRQNWSILKTQKCHIYNVILFIMTNLSLIFKENAMKKGILNYS